MAKKSALMEKIYEESDRLVHMLNQQRKDRPEDSAECGYKIIVATILPILLDRVRVIFFFLSFILGFLLSRLF